MFRLVNGMGIDFNSQYVDELSYDEEDAASDKEDVGNLYKLQVSQSQADVDSHLEQKKAIKNSNVEISAFEDQPKPEDDPE